MFVGFAPSLDAIPTLRPRLLMTSPQLPSSEVLAELVRYRMPFGKYRGSLLLRLPEAYLVWLSQGRMPGGKLGMLLESALIIRHNGLLPLLEPLLLEEEKRGAD